MQGRARIKEAVRRHLLDGGFTEVETPALQVSPGHETHVSAFRTQSIGADGVSTPLTLHTSPELTCKKLLAAGMERLFTLASVYRNRERGRLHHPEFLMLEWYRVGEPLEALIEDAGLLLRSAATAAGTGRLRHRGLECDPYLAPEILTVCEAFHRHAGIDLAAMLPTDPESFARFSAAARGHALRVAADDTWSDLFSKLLSAVVEPSLGIGRPTFLTRYPASEAALARLYPDDPRFAERFELYCCGVEVANAFAELTDPAEQRRRFVEAEAERERIYGERLALDEDFLAALAIMPASCGIALGFDRLVMLTTGADTVAAVMWAPVAEPV